jgi:hypothetical protein
VVDVQLSPRLGEDVMREVRDRDPEMGVTEVDPDGKPSRRIQREKHRRPSPGLPMRHAGRIPMLAEQPGLDQIGDDARDGGTRETGGARQLGPAGLPPVAKGSDHAAAV